MAHEISASILVGLPEDPQQMAEALGEVAEAWAQLLAAIEQRKPDVSFSVNEVRAKVQRRPRKPRTPSVGEVRGILREPEAA